MHVKTTAKTIKSTKHFNYGDLDSAIDAMARTFREPRTQLSIYHPDLIIGINRGGLIPATLLSYKMSIPLGIISIQTYNNSRESRTLQVNANIYTTIDVGSVCSALIVDDIADSGETLGIALAEMKKKIPCISTATLHYKEKSIIKPDFYYQKINDDVWIEYPWKENRNLL